MKIEVHLYFIIFVFPARHVVRFHPRAQKKNSREVAKIRDLIGVTERGERMRMEIRHELLT